LALGAFRGVLFAVVLDSLRDAFFTDAPRVLRPCALRPCALLPCALLPFARPSVLRERDCEPRTSVPRERDCEPRTSVPRERVDALFDDAFRDEERCWRVRREGCAVAVTVQHPPVTSTDQTCQVVIPQASPGPCPLFRVSQQLLQQLKEEHQRDELQK